MAREVNIFPGLLAISTFVNCLFTGPFANWVNLLLIFCCWFYGGGVLVYSRNNPVFDVKISDFSPILK